MNRLKQYLITTCLVVSTSLFSYGQKTLNEYTIESTLLEEIDPSSIADIEAYQKAKFETPRGGNFTTAKLVSSKHARVYRLKGSDDLLQVSQRLDKELLNNWGKAILWYSGFLTPTESSEYTRYEERLDKEGYKAYIFFTENYKLTNSNFILYQHKRTGLTLLITYISNSPDDAKIATMRAIVNDLKVE